MSLPVTILEKTSNGEIAAYDIYSRLLKDRIIFLGEEITNETASCIIAQLLHLSFSCPKKDIHFYIMSPGGEISPGLAIYDTMQFIRNDVATYCVGEASSMGAVLLAAGAKGKRFSLPSSRIMLHQPWTITGSSDARDLEIMSMEMNRSKKLIYQRLHKHTGRSMEELEKDCDRDFYMSANEAKTYGIVDAILEKAIYPWGSHGKDKS